MLWKLFVYVDHENENENENETKPNQTKLLSDSLSVNFSLCGKKKEFNQVHALYFLPSFYPFARGYTNSIIA